MAALLLTSALVIGTTVPGFAQDFGATAAPTVQNTPPVVVDPTPVTFENVPVVQSVPTAEPTPQSMPESATVTVPRTAASLRHMVDSVDYRAPEDAQLRCLAAGVYFESNGESLAGQLAVAHVILNRATSGRFASSLCGVLTQRGQFSFVRGGVVPQPANNAGWRTAVAIARIAQAESWANPAPGALFFHAARISPGWNRPRVARIDNHIFYR